MLAQKEMSSDDRNSREVVVGLQVERPQSVRPEISVK